MVEMSCGQCGGKSPMGAIFCRECGAKLDIEAMKPKVTRQSTEGGIRFTKLAVRRLISLVVIVGLLLGVWFLFADAAPSLPDSTTVSEREINMVDSIYDRISGTSDRKTFPAISGTAVTYHFAKILKEGQTGQEGANTMLFKDAIFEFYDVNHIKIDLRSELSLFGMKKMMSAQMIVTFENNSDGVVFDVKSVKHGMFTLPVLKDKLVFSKMKQLVPAGDDLDVMIGKLKELKISDDGKLSITLK